MSLSTHPLTPRFGLEVLGVDLASVDEATFVALRALWQTEPLLLLRRQCLDEAELVALSRRFGELHVLRRDYVHPPRHPEVLYVSNLRTEAGTRLGTLGSSELGWHTDQSYQPRPATGAVFQAVEVPEGTGATEWCNTVLAYAALPDTVRAAIASRRGVSRYNAYERETGLDEARKAALRAQHPPVAHPLVLTHPDTI